MCTKTRGLLFNKLAIGIGWLIKTRLRIEVLMMRADSDPHGSVSPLRVGPFPRLIEQVLEHDFQALVEIPNNLLQYASVARQPYG